jgi:hypothetical protein
MVIASHNVEIHNHAILIVIHCYGPIGLWISVDVTEHAPHLSVVFQLQAQQQIFIGERELVIHFFLSMYSQHPAASTSTSPLGSRSRAEYFFMSSWLQPSVDALKYSQFEQRNGPPSGPS